MSGTSQTGTFDDSRPLDAPAELPPVEPPSAGFIMQLFVIPAVIVLVVVLVWLLFGKLAGGERDVGDYIETIRSGNETRRWRAAYELASLIGNDKRLAEDPQLLGNLTALLDQELERAGDPRLRVYLAVTLGSFQTLEAQSPSGRPVDPLQTLSRAVGPKQPNEVRAAAVESLARQAARLEGRLTEPAVIEALTQASTDPEPGLRKRATYALGFCGGEGVLKPLRDRLQDEDRDVRYNAALALGRRGDAAALATFREMLSTPALQQVVPLENQAEKQSHIETVEVQALRALEMSVRAGAPGLAQLLRKEVADLTRSNLVSVRLQAEAVLKSLQPLQPLPEPQKTSQRPLRPPLVLT